MLVKDQYSKRRRGAALENKEAHTVLNARVSYQTDDERWELAFGVKNLTNEKYRLYTNDVSSLSIGLDGYAPPRWFSGTLTYRFY